MYGRLSAEKGIFTLLEAARRLPSIRVRIVGDGPLSEQVRAAVRNLPNVEFLGLMTPEQTMQAMVAARCVVIPSECFETFGRVVVEAFAAGVVVVAASIGALKELLDPDRTALAFRPGDAANLAARLDWVWSHPARVREMEHEARLEYERRFGIASNYRRLVEIYEIARQGARAAS